MTEKSIEIGEVQEIEALHTWFHHRSGSPYTEAMMIKELQDQERTQAEIKKVTGFSQPQISKRLALLTLIPELQGLLQEGTLRSSVAYQLTRLPSDIQKEYSKQERITLKEVEARSRELIVSKEILSLLDQPMDLPGNSPKEDEDPVERAKELVEELCNLCENYPDELADIRSEAWSLREIVFGEETE